MIVLKITLTIFVLASISYILFGRLLVNSVLPEQINRNKIICGASFIVAALSGVISVLFAIWRFI